MDKLETAPDERIDVRIFMDKDSILEKVTIEPESEGLEITNVEEGPDVIIKGNIAVKNLNEIEAVAEVNRIKHDRSL